MPVVRRSHFFQHELDPLGGVAIPAPLGSVAIPALIRLLQKRLKALRIPGQNGGCCFRVLAQVVDHGQGRSKAVGLSDLPGLPDSHKTGGLLQHRANPGGVLLRDALGDVPQDRDARSVLAAAQVPRLSPPRVERQHGPSNGHVRVLCPEPRRRCRGDSVKSRAPRVSLRCLHRRAILFSVHDCGERVYPFRFLLAPEDCLSEVNTAL
uniref:Uncharacterized protein n=1 Tax=Tetraselmis sp. GSL018 TaxID=582737 RepID=A0A061RUB5_9CHLO